MLRQRKVLTGNLVKRAITLSHPSFHSQNLKIVEQLLINNDYPVHFIKININNRIRKFKFSKPSSIVSKNTKLLLISIPFQNDLYYSICNQFKKFNIRTVPLINYKLNNIIKFGKDPTKKEDTTGVVYKITCKTCSSVYIGETKRALKNRISDHESKKNSESVVSKHMENTSHSFDFLNVQILDKEQNYKKRIISEMLYINNNKNTLNRKEDTQFLSHIYKHLTSLL